MKHYTLIFLFLALFAAACDDDTDNTTNNLNNTNNNANTNVNNTANTTNNATNNTTNNVNNTTNNTTGTSDLEAHAQVVITGAVEEEWEFTAEHHVVCAEGMGDFMIVANTHIHDYDHGVRFTLGFAYMTYGEREFDAETTSPAYFDGTVTLEGVNRFVFGDDYSEPDESTLYSHCVVVIGETTSEGWLQGTVTCENLVTNYYNTGYEENTEGYDPTINLTLTYTCPYVIQ